MSQNVVKWVLLHIAGGDTHVYAGKIYNIY